MVFRDRKKWSSGKMPHLAITLQVGGERVRKEVFCKKEHTFLLKGIWNYKETLGQKTSPSEMPDMLSLQPHQ